MDIDYTKMKSETMSVLSNPTIISYSLIFCSTLILGYYTLHDSQAFKPSEESEESKSSLFPSSEKEEPAPEPSASTSLFGGPEKEESAPASNGLFGAPETKEEPAVASSSGLFGDSDKKEEPAAAPEKEEEKPQEKPIGTGGKKSRGRRKKTNKSKKNRKL